jgi:hypothetical protein
MDVKIKYDSYNEVQKIPIQIKLDNYQIYFRLLYVYIK